MVVTWGSALSVFYKNLDSRIFISPYLNVYPLLSLKLSQPFSLGKPSLSYVQSRLLGFIGSKKQATSFPLDLTCGALFLSLSAVLKY